jgi:hypothetical protein
MCDKGAAGRLDWHVVALLKGRIRYLECRLARYERGNYVIPGRPRRPRGQWDSVGPFYRPKGQG